MLVSNSFDPFGAITSHQWRKIAGPNQFLMVSANQSQTVVRNLATGNYQFEITVSDSRGLS